MSLTLGMTGMDPATETALRAAFGDANAQVGGRWNLVPETEAEHVMVDMDSMYGPMSWLRLHAAGKRVIGLTTAPRTQTDFRLGRPFDSEAFATLLREVERASGISTAGEASGLGGAPLPSSGTASPAVPRVAPTAAAPAPDDARATQDESRDAVNARLSPSGDKALPAPTHDATDATAAAVASPITDPAAAAHAVEAAQPVALSPAAPSGSTPAPAPQDQLPEEVVHAVNDTPHAAATPDPLPEPLPATPQRDPTLADWLADGSLPHRARYRRSAGPMLLIDPVARTYHGPSTLKPLMPYFRDAVTAEAFEPLDDASWTRESATAGAPQPLLRLQWLGAMVDGRAALGDDHAAGTRFRLTKWPQTEREFPKHFRIATAMMKGPATLAEIADASTMPIDEVFEFVNANLVTGFAERVVETPVDTTRVDAPRTGGLLGRLRGR